MGADGVTTVAFFIAPAYSFLIILSTTRCLAFLRRGSSLNCIQLNLSQRASLKDQLHILVIHKYVCDTMEARTKDMFLPPTRIDTKLISELDDLVKRFGYSSRSELVREAIADKISELKGMEIVQVRGIPKEEARKEILKYIKRKDRVYASDIADELRLDLSLTFEIIDELFKEDALEVVP